MKNLYQIEHKMKDAYEFEIQGKPLHALQIYQSIINEYPAYTEAYFALADVYEKLDNIEPALRSFEELINTEPENKSVRLYYGQYLLRNKRWNEAIEVMSYLLPGEEPMVSFFLGYSHFMLQEYELAKINFLNFINSEEKTDLLYEAFLYLAKVEIQLKNDESALLYLKKTEIFYSDSWELSQLFAEVYYNLEMYAHAVVPIEKAIKLNSKDPSSYEWAGKINLKLGDYIKAEKYFLKYIELTEDASSDVYTKLAEACLKVNKLKAALNYYDIALKLDPKNYTASEGKKNASFLLEKNTG